MQRPARTASREGEAWIVPFAKPATGNSPLAGWRVDQAKPATFPDRLFHWESFAPPPSDNAEPYTLQWYLAIEHQRHGRQARWIPQLLEFGKHPGETLLGLGHGLGTDWVQYARNGAKVIACSPVAEELSLIRQNFELRGLRGRFLHADPIHLPLAGASVDVALVNGLLHDLSQPEQLVLELFRILRPGGKVVVVVPARYGARYWARFWRWTLIRPPADLLNVPQSPWDEDASEAHPPRTFSGRQLRRIFGPFANHRIHKRHIRRRELPWISRCLPRDWLERWFGNYLILKAFKPVGMVQQRAAA